MRAAGLDRLRGLAVLAMVIDHLALLGGVEPLRWSVGRIALPIFAVLAGHLVHRLSWRWAWVAVVGALLPVAVPWIDSPNVLVLLAAGAVVVRVTPPWLGLVVCLGLLANGAGGQWGTGYPLVAVIALMLAGRLVTTGALARVGDRLPGWLSWAGRYPLSVYVGHLVVLAVLVEVAS